MMTGPAALILSVLMLAGLLLGSAGIWLIAGKRDAKRGWLMIAAALVMFANVAIWAVPV